MTRFKLYLPYFDFKDVAKSPWLALQMHDGQETVTETTHEEEFNVAGELKVGMLF